MNILAHCNDSEFHIHLFSTQLLSLTMDGLTGAVQERMIAESKTKSGHMMLNMNLFSIGYLAIGMYRI